MAVFLNAPKAVGSTILRHVNVSDMRSLALVNKENFKLVSENGNIDKIALFLATKKMNVFLADNRRGEAERAHLIKFVEKCLDSLLAGSKSKITSLAVVVATKKICAISENYFGTIIRDITNLMSHKILVFPANIKIYFVGIEALKRLRETDRLLGNDFVQFAIRNLCRFIGNQSSENLLSQSDKIEILTEANQALACYTSPLVLEMKQEYVSLIVDACYKEFMQLSDSNSRYSTRLIEIAYNALKSSSMEPNIDKFGEMLKKLDGSLFLEMKAKEVSALFRKAYDLSAREDWCNSVGLSLCRILQRSPRVTLGRDLGKIGRRRQDPAFLSFINEVTYNSKNPAAQFCLLHQSFFIQRKSSDKKELAALYALMVGRVEQMPKMSEDRYRCLSLLAQASDEPTQRLKEALLAAKEFIEIQKKTEEVLPENREKIIKWFQRRIKDFVSDPQAAEELTRLASQI